MDRFWLLTWRTYGTWLPGDPRGSVTRVRVDNGSRIEHDTPGTAMDGAMPALEHAARAAMKGPPILLTQEQADAVADQFIETARFRGWSILAGAVMCNHVHLVLGVPGDPSPTKLLGDFKAWGTRRLDIGWGKPAGETWWTDGGSKRKLPAEESVLAAVAYVYCQPNALRVWVAEGWEPSPESPVHGHA